MPKLSTVLLPLGRCGAVFIALVACALGALEAYLRWRVASAAHLAPLLPEVDTFHESEISWETFYQDYVLKRRPVKIVLAQPDTFNLTKLGDECGSNRVTLMSDATYTAMLEIQERVWLHRLFDWVAMPLIGRYTSWPGS